MSAGDEKECWKHFLFVYLKDHSVRRFEKFILQFKHWMVSDYKKKEQEKNDNKENNGGEDCSVVSVHVLVLVILLSSTPHSRPNERVQSAAHPSECSIVKEYATQKFIVQIIPVV